MNGALGKFIEEKIRLLCEWKKAVILELNVLEDHIHVVVVIPPKLSISEFMGTLKGKTAISIFKSFSRLKKKPYWGNHFWSRGYCISTIGLDEEKIRRYVKFQEKNERLDENNEHEYSLF